jgi:ADP-L-glycero-D-manno-heptose 6-epimerase
MQSVVAKSFPKAQAGETIELFKSHRDGIADGDQRRDFVYVDDVVAVVLWFLDAGRASGIFNVGSGSARSFRELAEAVFHALGKAPSIRYVDMPVSIRDKYQYRTQASLDRLRQAGYAAPFTGLEAAVTDYVTRYLAQPDPYR